MEVICKNCQRKNLGSSLFCQHCKLPLKPYQQITKTLYERVNRLESDYQTKIAEVKEQLTLLANFQESGEKVTGSVPVPKPQPKPILATDIIKQKVTIPAAKPKAVPLAEEPEPVTPIIREPSALELQMQAFFKPVSDSINWLTGLYTKYKSEGKLPIFLMTIAGIIAMLFGFGYLMQVTFQKLGDFGPVLKVALGFMTAIASIIIALRLYKQKNKYEEYASALASMGIILNYLMIYFLSDLGNFPLLSSSLLGFGLIILNTGFAILLSLRFQTKIVAVLSLIGGAFAPFYLNSTSDGTLYYAYLWLLVLGANFVAQKINWKTLHYLSFVIGVGLLGITAFDSVPNTLIFTLYYHLFAYLFFYYTFFEGRKLKENLEKIELFLLAGNLSFILYSLYANYLEQFNTLGIIYLINAVVFGLLMRLFWAQLSSQLKRIIPVVIASFIGLAIPSLLGHSLMGLFWSIEALLLIQLGFIGKLPIVRKEGYLLLLVGFFKIAQSIFQLVYLSTYQPWGNWYFNIVALVVVLLLLWRQFQHYYKQFVDFEKSLHSLFRNAFPAVFSFLFMVSAYNLFGFWAFVASIVPLYGLAWWGRQLNSKMLIAFSFFYLLLLLPSFPISAYYVDSFHFSDQLGYAKVSLALFLGSLWFMKQFFHLVGIQSAALTAVSQVLRIGFFLIVGILPIGFTNRHFPEYLSMVMWASLLIPFLFHKLLKYKALVVEFYLLFVFAFLGTLGEPSLLAISVGIISILGTHLIDRAYNHTQLVKSDFKLYMGISPYIWALLIVYIPYMLWDSYMLSTLLYSTLLLLLLSFKERLAMMKNLMPVGITLAILININVILIVISNHSANDLYVLIAWFNMALIFWLLVNRMKWYSAYQNAKWSLDLVFSQLVFIAVYVTSLHVLGIKIEGIIMTILLAVHAVCLVFISLKNRLKTPNYLSIIIFVTALLKVVFNDITSLATTQKVIVLIVIGALLLGAAYFYTRLKKYFDEQSGADNQLEE